MTPKPPQGYRLLSVANRESVRPLSGYLARYPEILMRTLMLKGRRWVAGPYRFFWDDAVYCVPIS